MTLTSISTNSGLSSFSLSGVGNTATKLLNYLSYLMSKNYQNLSSIPAPIIGGYSNLTGHNPGTNGYWGGAYLPSQNRIIFAPNGTNSTSNRIFHYIDCNSGNVSTYDSGWSPGTFAASAFAGAVFSPIENLVYFVTYGLSDWAYSNGSSITTFSTQVPGSGNSYLGGAYSPLQQRIYYAPAGDGNSSYWHYIDTSSSAGSANKGVSYINNSGHPAVANAYAGAVYSPGQNRIYFVPCGQAPQAYWHYIDCSTGNVVAYLNNVTDAVSNAYVGGVYSPSQNRIYFVPYHQADQANWHYINCSTGNVGEYTHLTAAAYAYSGGAYSPSTNRIYFAPYGQANQANWHYMDCNTGTLVAYANTSGAVSGAYQGAVFSPTQNRIYLVPYVQANNVVWHYIQETSDVPFSRQLMSSPLFNAT